MTSPWSSVALLVGAGLLMIYAGYEMNNLMSKAIDHGCAHYSPTTGAFEWKDK